MKVKEREQARVLRQQGWSINDIYQLLGVGKGSVSIWVRDIELTPSQRQELSTHGHSKDVIEKRRKTRLTRENLRRKIVVDNAQQQINQISRDELFLIGLALYWAEGSKTKRGIVELSNSNPELIMVAMRFFREICNVSEERFRGHVYLHPHLNTSKAEQYWSLISAIPPRQFYKTSTQQSRSSKNKRDTLPYGTFAINICDTTLWLKMKGWMQGMVEQLMCNAAPQLKDKRYWTM